VFEPLLFRGVGYRQQPIHVSLVRKMCGGDSAQAEAGTPTRGHLANGRFVYYKYQLATQVDRGQVHLSQKSDSSFHELSSSQVAVRLIVAKFDMCAKGPRVRRDKECQVAT